MAKSNAQKCREYRQRQGAAIGLPMPPATKQALEDLMAWHGFDDQREAIATMIHRMHELGRDGSAALFTVPRHEVEITENVARTLLAQGERRAAE